MKNKRIAAIVASLGLAAMTYTAVPMSTNAAEDYTPISGETYTFEKYLVMENDANVPNVSFDFTVTSVTPTEENVFAGPAGIKFTAAEGSGISVETDTPNKATVQFKSNDTKKPESDAGSKTINFVTDSKSDESFASKTLTLDLSEVTFSQPGIYRYEIVETSSDNIAGISPDVQNKRNLDIYVQNGSTPGTLVIDGFILYYGTMEKTTGFTNQYNTNNLVVEKKVTGNHGSKNKHFKMTVKLTNEDDLQINDNDTFAVIGNFEKEPKQNDVTSYDDATMKAANNIDHITYADLKGDGYSFYLCDGHYFEIKGIPSGLGYSVTEYQEEYTPSVSFAPSGDTKTDDKTGDGTAIEAVKTDSETPLERQYAVTDSYLTNDASVTFTNERTGSIPTGILMTVAGSAGIAAIGIAGVAAGTIYLRKKKSEEE